jgi:hypothetical protein
MKLRNFSMNRSFPSFMEPKVNFILEIDIRFKPYSPKWEKVEKEEEKPRFSVEFDEDFVLKSENTKPVQTKFKNPPRKKNSNSNLF